MPFHTDLRGFRILQEYSRVFSHLLSSQPTYLLGDNIIMLSVLESPLIPPTFPFSYIVQLGLDMDQIH